MIENNKQSITVVIPVYNEAEGILSFMNKLLNVTLNHPLWNFNIIVVDDGSTDGTSEQLKTFKNITLLSHKHNHGYGAALKTGISHSTAERIVIIDADNSYDPNDILKLLPFIKYNDMVVGVRTGTTFNSQYPRRFGKWIICKIAHFLTGMKIPDINSGLRIIDKSVVDKFMYLLPDGFSFTSTITIATLVESLGVHFEPISYHTRTGSTKIKPLADFLRFLNFIIVTVLCFNPVRVFLPISLCFFAGFFLILFFSYLYLEKVMDITAILFFVSGVHFFGIGLIAELVVRLSKKEGIKHECIIDKPTENK